jgi:hypothetical protein
VGESPANLLQIPANAAPARRGAPRFVIHPDKPGPWLQLGVITAYEWTRIDIYMAGLPQPLHGLRVVHLSDLHLRPRWYEVYNNLLKRLAESPPDLIVFTGDFVEHRADHRKTLPILERFVVQMRSRLGVYAIIGNHDGDLLRPRLHEWAVNVICGRMATLANHEAAIELVGIPSVTRDDLAAHNGFFENLPDTAGSALRVILCHFPDSILRLPQTHSHLILAGHTHGGQVCLPGGYPIITHDRLPRPMHHGVHEIDDKLLIVNRGFGFASMPLRLFCPPEVIELRIGR